MQRLASPALYVAAGLVVTGAGALSVTAGPLWSPRHWPELAMSLVVAPALAWLAMDFWLARHGWYSALFGALAAERIYLLAQAAGAEGAASGNPHPGPEGALPLVLLLSVVLFRLALGRILARLHEWAASRVTSHESRMTHDA
jgi:hypothetical protein